MSSGQLATTTDPLSALPPAPPQAPGDPVPPGGRRGGRSRHSGAARSSEGRGCGRSVWKLPAGTCPRLAEHRVVLLGHPDERRPLAELFEFGGPHVGAGGPQSPQDIQDRVFYVSSVRHFHRLALRRSGRKRKCSFTPSLLP